MGGITLADNPPDESEGSLAFSAGPCNPTLLKDLALLNFANVSPSAPITLDTTSLGTSNAAVDGSATHANTATSGSVPSFSISDFLVPGLQTKVWEDWQGADDLNDYTNSAFGQDFTSDFNAAPFQFGLDGMIGNTPVWDNASIPADQAYDEFVFDLAPSAFETPTTVNVADLIVGPNSMAGAASVSPSDLTMAPVSTYEDLALANLYGFTESSTAFDSDSDLDDAEDSEDEDESDEEETQVENAEKQVEQTVVESASIQSSAPESLIIVEATTAVVEDNQEIASVVPMNKPEDPNKRRMEEALVARISNDLGPEHMTGLFAILKGDGGQVGEDEDEEMEVDLSCLDETTLVQVYQYVETCCMQTMGSILAAEEHERAAKAAAQAAAAEREAMERERQYYASRTPELSPCHSSASSSSPSPPHPSSLPSPSKGRRSNGGNKKRNSGNAPPTVVYHEGYDVDQDAPWNASQATKSKRKRVSSGNMAGVGGGGTGKGRRIQKDFYHYHQQQQHQQETVVLRAADEDEMEYGEDAEIDIVGI